MAVIKLIPRNSSITSGYLYTDAANMYTDTNSDTYSQISLDGANSNGVVWLYDFNIEDIPFSSIKEVKSITAKIKASNAGVNAYISTKGKYTNYGQIGISNLKVYTFTNVTLTLNDIKTLGSDLSIRMQIYQSTYSKIQIYGAEILLEYVPLANKVVYGEETLIDLTSDTVTADTLLQGYTAHDNTGALITGTASGGSEHGNVWQDSEGYVVLDDESGISLQTKNATPSESAQTITPDEGYYALDKVNIAAIPSTESSWELLSSKDVYYANSENTRTSVTTINIAEPYDPTKILWITVRDTQGKRETYYYGTDIIYIACDPSTSSNSFYSFVRMVGMNSGAWQTASADAYGGIFVLRPTLSNSSMTIPLYGKRNDTYKTGNIDSTYRINVYYLNYPGNISSLYFE